MLLPPLSHSLRQAALFDKFGRADFSCSRRTRHGYSTFESELVCRLRDYSITPGGFFKKIGPNTASFFEH
jgi:hypothetical protein